MKKMKVFLVICTVITMSVLLAEENNSGDVTGKAEIRDVKKVINLRKQFREARRELRKSRARELRKEAADRARKERSAMREAKGN